RTLSRRLFSPANPPSGGPPSVGQLPSAAQLIVASLSADPLPSLRSPRVSSPVTSTSSLHTAENHQDDLDDFVSNVEHMDDDGRGSVPVEWYLYQWIGTSTSSLHAARNHQRRAYGRWWRCRESGAN
ncbi:unnamed protein product, partial [Linum tenue]